MSSEHEQDTNEPGEVLRWYTRARKIPRFVGKAPGGGRYPGGPYTITQAVGGSAVLMIGQQTMGVWGHFGLLPNLLILAVAVTGTLFGLRLVKPGGRDPVSAAVALVGVSTCGRWGRQAGRKLAPSRPHQVRHRVNACLAGGGPVLTVTDPATPQGPLVAVPDACVSAAADRTVVGQLLAQVRTGHPSRPAEEA